MSVLGNDAVSQLEEGRSPEQSDQRPGVSKELQTKALAKAGGVEQ